MALTLWYVGFSFSLMGQDATALSIPYLDESPRIDGDISEWKEKALNDGEWDFERVKISAWYEQKRNRLHIDSLEDTNNIDLSSRYYIAWDQSYLYFGAEVEDNEHDVTDTNHEPKRWYYKDAIAFFFEAPRDTIAEKFGSGDHAFCFVIDTLMPEYGAWWRHGNEKQTYIEEPLPTAAVDYSIKMNPWNRSGADYVLEARVKMASTFGSENEAWAALEIGDVYSMMIVHCDPDGGEYGGHLLIYGKGDDDASWGKVQLVESVEVK